MRTQADESLLRSGVRVPSHVVYRHFADATVVLNLDNGRYHGLNSTAARMLEALRASKSVDAAIERLADELDQPRARIELDMLRLCRVLADRGLVEPHEPSGR